MKRERGFVLVSALLFMAAALLLLNALALRASFAARDGDARAEREAALHEARGGLRRAAARGEVGLEGALRVERDGERLVATFGSARVSALWRDGRLSAWEED